jgi:polyhydroxybutyrate depolymerase
MTASRRSIVVMGLISIPLLLALVEGTAYAIRNRSTATIVSSGVHREYVLHVPGGYQRGRPSPLVISMHGAGGWPVQQMEISRWNSLADQFGFLVVYPSGLRRSGPTTWRATGGDDERADVRFIADLLDTMRVAYTIDASRIYATGLSNGAGMAFVLSCTMSDRIAAVGLVAGAHLLPWRWCKDERPVPMMAFHGTADPMAPYRGGVTFISPVPFPDIPTWTANWARRNRCGALPIDTAVAAGVARRSYGGCAGGAEVVLYTLEGAGHVWPGGGPLPEWFVGPMSDVIDASREMWTFFQEHPLRDRSF